jgi:hypothetical protein
VVLSTQALSGTGGKPGEVDVAMSVFLNLLNKS